MKLFDALAERLPSAERGALAASASAPRLSATRDPIAKQRCARPRGARRARAPAPSARRRHNPEDCYGWQA